MTPRIGVIADDVTGATDAASMLARAGLRTIQTIGDPADGLLLPESDAIVVALKSRSCPPEEAIALSIRALRYLQRIGASQFIFKYCSTFDSTSRGNIGPVIDALMEALATNFTIACPAFPDNGRTVFQGHLFVGDRLLSESGMQNHPLNPMKDANLVRVLGEQTTSRVGLVSLQHVRQGAVETRKAFADLQKAGIRVAIVDAFCNDDLLTIGEAAMDLKLLTGASGVAWGLAAHIVHGTPDDATTPAVHGPAAVVAGSCSAVTRHQIEIFESRHPSFHLDVAGLFNGHDQLAEVLDWASQRLGKEPVLIAASAPPDQVSAVQALVGAEKASAVVEEALSRIARGLVALGVRRLVVAGGETSGAVVKALGIRALRIGNEIATGVPWTTTIDPEPIAIALKSGNFGSPDFFLEAFRRLP